MKFFEFLNLIEKEQNEYSNFEINKFENDSRNLNDNDVFVAIKTENNDGNLFANEAIKKGARALLLSTNISKEFNNFNNIVKFKEPIAKVGEASSLWLKKYVKNTIAITGSAGKTTTKALTEHLLNSKFKVKCSEGNYNNTIGLPITILNNVDSPLDFYVAEMGMSFKGEINTLVNLYSPNIRVWLNVLTAHMGNFANIDELREAKAEILNNKSPEDLIIFNNDNLLVRARVNQEIGQKLSFGFNETSDFVIKSCNSTLKNTVMEFQYDNKNYEVKFNLCGKHNCYNVAACILTALQCNVDMDLIMESLTSFMPVEMRGIVKESKGVTVYDDCYNSNPDALKSVIEMLSLIKAKGRKVAVIGDMLELGKFSKTRHNEIGSFINSHKIDVVVCFGEEMKATFDVINENVEKYWFSSSKEVSKEIGKILKKEDVAVVKASRGMKGEVIVSTILED